MRTSVVHIGDDNINTISGIYSKIGNGAEDSEHKMKNAEGYRRGAGRIPLHGKQAY